MDFVDALTGPLGQRLTWTLLHFTWQGSALAGLLLCMGPLLAVRSAAARYRLALATLLLMAACPLVTFWFVGPAEQPARENGDRHLLPERPCGCFAQKVPVPVFPTPAAPVVAAPSVRRTRLWVKLPAAGLPAAEPPAAGPLVVAAVPETPAEAEPAPPPPVSAVDRFQPYLLGGWAAGAALFGLRLLAGGAAAWRIRRGRRPLGAEWAARARRLALRLGLPAARVFVSDRVRQSLVTGLLRPMVLLPAAWLMEMTPEMLEAVLAHELAHLRRLDLWAILLQRLVETLLFYHPAVWWLSRRLNRQRELCCDEMAVSAAGDRLVYAKALQWAVQGRAGGMSPLLGAAWKGNQTMIVERIRRVLGVECPRERISWWPIGLAALVAPMLLVLAAIDRLPQAAATAEEPQATAAPTGGWSGAEVGTVPGAHRGEYLVACRIVERRDGKPPREKTVRKSLCWMKPGQKAALADAWQTPFVIGLDRRDPRAVQPIIDVFNGGTFVKIVMEKAEGARAFLNVTAEYRDTGDVENEEVKTQGFGLPTVQDAKAGPETIQILQVLTKRAVAQKWLGAGDQLTLPLGKIREPKPKLGSPWRAALDDVLGKTGELQSKTKQTVEVVVGMPSWAADLDPDAKVSRVAGAGRGNSPPVPYPTPAPVAGQQYVVPMPAAEYGVPAGPRCFRRVAPTGAQSVVPSPATPCAGKPVGWLAPLCTTCRGETPVMLKACMLELDRAKLRASAADWKRLGIDPQAGQAILKRLGRAGQQDLTVLNAQQRAELMRLLEGNPAKRILAEPTLVTLSGRPAVLQAGGEIPWDVRGSNKGDAKAWKSYGTRLDSCSTVLDGDRVRCEFRLEVSWPRARDANAGDTPMDTLTSISAETGVELRSGQTVLMTGLKQAGAASKAPKAGEGETEIWLLLTPTVLDPKLPPELATPSEKSKVSLPPYRIEPPDVLHIEMLKLVPLPPYRLDVFDVLQVRAANARADQPIDNYYMIEAEGTINLGPAYGTVRVACMTIDEIKQAIDKKLRQSLPNPQVSVHLARVSGAQPVTGQYLVGPDGTINLRRYGVVHVAGKTTAEARAAIQKQLAKFLDSPELSVEVVAYNSKVYYVITQGGGVGDSVRRLPVTGNETVLDAIANVGGLLQASKTRIWIARPIPKGCQQILPVDWEQITQGGKTATNYQVLPGDRIFISEPPPAPHAAPAAPANDPTPQDTQQRGQPRPAARIGRERYITKTYPVGDLVALLPSPPAGGKKPAAGPAVAKADFGPLVKLITSAIQPATWAAAGGRGEIGVYEPNLSLVVSQTQDVHEAIVDLLENLRRKQDVQVVLELRMLKVDEHALPAEMQGKGLGRACRCMNQAEQLADALRRRRGVESVAMSQSTLFDGQTAVIRPLADGSVRTMPFVAQVVVSNDRRHIRLRLRAANPADKAGSPAESPFSGWFPDIPDGHPLVVEMPLDRSGRPSGDPRPSDAKSPKAQRLLLVTPRIVIQEEEEERIGDAGKTGVEKIPTAARNQAIAKPAEPPRMSGLDLLAGRVETDAYSIEFGRGNRVAALDKRAGKTIVLALPDGNRPTEAIVGDNVVACEMARIPVVTQLIAFNPQRGKWSSFRLPARDLRLDARLTGEYLAPIVSDNLVCYQIRGLIIAYSAATDTWGTLAVDGFPEPAVGDDAIRVETATGKSEFTAKRGTWATVKKPAASRPSKAGDRIVTGQRPPDPSTY